MLIDNHHRIRSRFQQRTKFGIACPKCLFRIESFGRHRMSLDSVQHCSAENLPCELTPQQAVLSTGPEQ